MNITAQSARHKSPLEVEAEAAKLDPSKCVIAFEHVSKTFGKHTAVKDVTFRVYDRPEKGEFVCVLGPSGCGKSTVLNMIAGFYGPTDGQVLMFGQPVGPPDAERGFVFQSYGSFPHLRVWENIAFGLLLKEMNRRDRNPVQKVADMLLGVRGARRRRIKEEAMEWVRSVGLDRSEEKYPHQLSGGMRQRVALARTLAVKPKIILMDEPFGALDRVTRWEMQDLLISLWREKEPTVFLVTHDIPEAVYLADRIYIFTPAPGRIEEEIDVPMPDLPAAEMQRTTEFSELVNEISRKVELVLGGTGGAGGGKSGTGAGTTSLAAAKPSAGKGRDPYIGIDPEG